MGFASPGVILLSATAANSVLVRALRVISSPRRAQPFLYRCCLASVGDLMDGVKACIAACICLRVWLGVMAPEEVQWL